MNSHKCEVCEEPATKACGLEDQPMLFFCDGCYSMHVTEAHVLTELT